MLVVGDVVVQVWLYIGIIMLVSTLGEGAGVHHGWLNVDMEWQL